MAMLAYREAAGDVRFERHHCRRIGRHGALDIVAVQVQRSAPLARPAQLDLVAALHAQGARRLTGGDFQVEHLGRPGRRRAARSEREAEKDSG
jgi:hypothetical protein